MGEVGVEMVPMKEVGLPWSRSGAAGFQPYNVRRHHSPHLATFQNVQHVVEHDAVDVHALHGADER